MSANLVIIQLVSLFLVNWDVGDYTCNLFAVRNHEWKCTKSSEANSWM